MNEENYVSLLKDIPADKEVYNVPLVLVDVDEKIDVNNDPFCIVHVADKDLNKYTLRKFQTSRIELEDLLRDGFYNCMVICSMFNNNRSYSLQAIGSKRDDIKTILPSTIDNAKNIFNKIIDELKKCNNSLKDIAIQLYETNKDQLLTCTAGKSVHHTHPGDLLSHTYTTMQTAYYIGKNCYNANIDLLIIGAALHDIGKLYELDVDEYGLTEYTLDGKLYGHSYIGAKMFMNKVKESEQEYNDKDVQLIEHMILSHHGEQKFGAVVCPITKEAFLLHYVDMLDSRMNIIENALLELEPGETKQAMFLFDQQKSSIYKP